MAVRKRDREMSKEEALKIANKALRDLWFGSPPLIGPVRFGDRVEVFPLSDEFNESDWLIAIVDITKMHGQNIVELFQVWTERYSDHQTRFLIVLKPRYEYFYSVKYMKFLLEMHKLQTSLVVLDKGGMLSEVFSGSKKSCIVHFVDGKVVNQGFTFSELQKLEEEFKASLREKDPGLPLFKIYQAKGKLRKDIQSIEFGKNSLSKFIVKESGEPEHEDFDVLKAEDPGTVIAYGVKNRTDDSMIFDQAESKLKFIMQAPSLRIIATIENPNKDPGKIVCVINGQNIPDENVGSDLVSTSAGQSMEIRQPKLYWIAENMPDGSREVTLSFPFAKHVPIFFHGVRMTDSFEQVE